MLRFSKADKAVFLDRDGVINPLIYYPDFGEWESPRSPLDFGIYPWVPKSLSLLKTAGYRLFVVSNQPSAVKGKTTTENLKAVAAALEGFSNDQGGLIDRAYYCYHHPDFTGPCACRKPGTFFPEQAVREYGLDPALCWFVGDQDNDMLCGKRMGFRTAKIDNLRSCHKSGSLEAEIFADNLYDVTVKILEKGTG